MLAALLVGGAAFGQSAVLLTFAAVVAVVLGAAATKITHSELIQSRVDAARDRAQQAQAYTRMAEEKARENADFAASMTERIAERQKLIHELEGEVALAQRRVAETRSKLGAEARRADQAEARLVAEGGRLEDAEQRAAEAIVLAAELEQEVIDLRAELQAWEDLATPDLRKHA
jgi:chromosome segregation ATPase